MVVKRLECCRSRIDSLSYLSLLNKHLLPNLECALTSMWLWSQSLGTVWIGSHLPPTQQLKMSPHSIWSQSRDFSTLSKLPTWCSQKYVLRGCWLWLFFSIKTKEIATSLEHSVWSKSNQCSSAMVTYIWLQNKWFFTPSKWEVWLFNGISCALIVMNMQLLHYFNVCMLPPILIATTNLQFLNIVTYL